MLGYNFKKTTLMITLYAKWTANTLYDIICNLCTSNKFS